MNTKKPRISVDEYARLHDIASEALPDGMDVLVLPGGAADKLVERLKCRKCRRVVCQAHDKAMRPKRGEALIKVPLNEREWTPFFPERVAREFADGLEVGL